MRLLYIGILTFVEATMKKVKHVKLRILEVILIDLPYYTANIDRMTEKPPYFRCSTFILHVFTLWYVKLLVFFLPTSTSSLHTKSETPCESKSFRFFILLAYPLQQVAIYTSV